MTQFDLFVLTCRIELHLAAAAAVLRLPGSDAARLRDLPDRIVAALVHAAERMRNKPGDLTGVDVSKLFAIHRYGHNGEFDFGRALHLGILAISRATFELRHIAALLSGRVPSVTEEDGRVEWNELWGRKKAAALSTTIVQEFSKRCLVSDTHVVGALFSEIQTKCAVFLYVAFSQCATVTERLSV